jgi:hypothetical protein
MVGFSDAGCLVGSSVSGAVGEVSSSVSGSVGEESDGVGSFVGLSVVGSSTGFVSVCMVGFTVGDPEGCSFGSSGTDTVKEDKE